MKRLFWTFFGLVFPMKFFLTLSFVFSMPFLGFSQKFIPGIRLGLNVSNLKSSQFSSFPRRGIDAGFTLTAEMGSRVDVISEFTFSQKGAILKGYDNSGADAELKMYFNSLQYAAIINYYIKAPNFSLQAGPFFAYNMCIAKDEVYFGKTKDPFVDMSSISLAEGITGLDVGPVLGISGGSESIRINARYMHGLINYFKEVDYDGLGYKVTGSTIHFSISYLFNNVRFTR
jgi:hypothetical protein